MKTIFSFIFSLSILTVWAQIPPNWVYAASIGGGGADNANDVVTDTMGNVYVIGAFNSPTMEVGALTAANRGGYDIFVAKFAADGAPIWLKSLGSTADDVGFAITSDGADIYATGTYKNTLYYTATNFVPVNGLANKSNIVVFKMEGSTGNVVWANSAGGTSFLSYDLFPRDIAISTTGTVLVAGQTAGEVRWGTTATGFTVKDTCNDCGFVAAWGKNVGTYGWTYTVRNPPYSSTYDCENSIRQIALDANNNIYAIGNYRNRNISNVSQAIFPGLPLYSVGAPSLTTQTAIGRSAFYVLKLGGDGLFSYVKDGSNSANKWVEGSSIWLDKAAQDLYFGGVFTDSYYFSGATGSTSSPNTNGFLIKADLNANLVWERHSTTTTPSISGGNSVNYITGNGKGGVYFGISAQANCDWYGAVAQGNTTDFSQVMLGRVSANGNTLWTKNIDGGAFQFVMPPAMHAISTATTDECWVAGYHGGFGISFDAFLVQGNAFSQDGFIAKLGNTVSNIESTPTKTYQLYPNPSNGQFFVQFEQNTSGNLTIIDAKGAKVYEETFQHQSTLNVQPLLLTGIYCIQICTEKGCETTKWMKN